MKRKYIETRFQLKSLTLIEKCNEVIEDWQHQGYSLSLRQLYYQLVSRNIIPNTEKSYKATGKLVSDARLAGLIDWNSIEDRTRNLRALPHWDHPGQIIDEATERFHYDLWAGQPVRVEVWVEKEALSDIVGRECRTYDVPYFACKGYTSQSEMWAASQRINGYCENGASAVVILSLGDHDPSGLDMTRDIRERLTLFCHADGFAAPIVRRIGLNMDQVLQYGLPNNPAKLTDKRADKYIEEFGPSSWELDALAPSVIAGLINEGIEEHLDREMFDAATTRQDEARSELAEIAGKLKKERNESQD